MAALTIYGDKRTHRGAEYAGLNFKVVHFTGAVSNGDIWNTGMSGLAYAAPLFAKGTALAGLIVPTCSNGVITWKGPAVVQDDFDLALWYRGAGGPPSSTASTVTPDSGIHGILDVSRKYTGRQMLAYELGGDGTGIDNADTLADVCSDGQSELYAIGFDSREQDPGVLAKFPIFSSGSVIFTGGPGAVNDVTSGRLLLFTHAGLNAAA